MDYIDFKKFTVNINTALFDAMKIMDKSGNKVIFVDDSGTLKGIITDGDFRRFILKGGDLSTPVSLVMNDNPIFAYENSKISPMTILKEKKIECIPIVDENKTIVSAVFREYYFEKDKYKINAPVVIMAGGKGQRLYPYTKILPKPLIPIGDYTILERIINNFVKFGCEKFYFTLNYKKNMIKAYFNDLDYNVEYIDEDEPLGTGGSLYFLKNKINETFFVSNCDILVETDYSKIFKFHKENKNLVTVVASLKNTVIPYGVIELNEDGSMKKTLERPHYNHLINTGMYVLEPEVLKDIKKPEFIHITNIIDNYIGGGKKVGVYPVSENSWLDMGQIKEMENMIREIENRG